MRSPARLPQFAVLTLVAALPFLAAGCAVGGGPSAPPSTERPVFGRPATSGPAAEPLGESSPRPSATQVTPSVSALPCTPAKKGRLCFSGKLVPPVIDPAKPCVDHDQGAARGVLYICFGGTWDAVPGITP